jgi:polygalacturonase
MSGTFKNLKIINTPKHVFSIGNKSKLVIDAVTVDNRAGDKLGSDGKSLGHNSCVALLLLPSPRSG